MNRFLAPNLNTDVILLTLEGQPFYTFDPGNQRKFLSISFLHSSIVKVRAPVYQSHLLHKARILTLYASTISSKTIKNLFKKRESNIYEKTLVRWSGSGAAASSQ